MIILITGASHTGKTLLAQKLLEKYSYPYLNIHDPACMTYKTLIFSKPLADNELVFWNNITIHLTEQIAKQRNINGHLGRNILKKH